jgi:hypothetical protein
MDQNKESLQDSTVKLKLLEEIAKNKQPGPLAKTAIDERAGILNYLCYLCVGLQSSNTAGSHIIAESLKLIIGHIYMGVHQPLLSQNKTVPEVLFLMPANNDNN